MYKECIDTAVELAVDHVGALKSYFKGVFAANLVNVSSPSHHTSLMQQIGLGLDFHCVQGLATANPSRD